MNPNFQSFLVPAVPTGESFPMPHRDVEPFAMPTFDRTPRGVYLRRIRRSLDMNLENGATILKISIPEFSGLETGAFTFAEASTWARIELALIHSQGAAWCGWVAHEKVWFASCRTGAVAWPRDGSISAEDIWKASEYLTFAAALQHQTVKRGILSRLAAALAIEAGRPEEAAKLARAGLVPDIGPMPEWLAAGLQDVIEEAKSAPPATQAEPTAERA